MKNVGSIAKASIPAVGTASFDTSAFKVAKFTPAVLDSTKKLTSTFKYVDTINGLNKKTFNNLKELVRCPKLIRLRISTQP